MAMHRFLMTLALASTLVGGLGFTALAQSTPVPLAQGQRTDRSDRPGRGYGRGLAAAAAQLGVSEAELKAALGLPAERPQRPDMTAVAAQLGVAEADLRETLRSTMHSARQQRQAGDRPNPGQMLTDAASQLGVSEIALRSALGIPDAMPRPDMAAAAAQLGVSEAELTDALRSNRGGPMPRRQTAPAE
jgi:putative heme degradation protein